MGSSGGSSGESYDTVTWGWSPQTAEQYGGISDVMSQVWNAAQTGTSAWQTPSAQNYMPTTNLDPSSWYSDLSSSGITEGYWDVINKAGSELMETLGYDAGSARAGASGMAGGVMSDYYSDAGSQLVQTLWSDMVWPSLSTQYGTEASMLSQQYGSDISGTQAPYYAAGQLLPYMMPTGFTSTDPLTMYDATQGSNTAYWSGDPYTPESGEGWWDEFGFGSEEEYWQSVDLGE